MSNRMDKVNKTLRKLLTASEELNGLLQNGSPESIVDKLEERESLLTDLIEQVSNGSNLEKEKATIRLILDLDKKNAELLEKRMNQTYESMTELLNQKRVVSNLKSFSKSKQKQVVDLLF
ncbi:MAG TPA: hypothetical protein VGA99_08835 [bacterium]